jgi:hypothetical protein
MVVLDRVSEHTLYLLSNCDCKCQALRVEGCGGARDIENPEQLAVGGVQNRSGRARPSLDFTAEMLDPMDLDRLHRSDGGSDRVGSDVGLGPVSTLLEVYDPTEIRSPWITRSFDNDSGWIREDDHGTCFSEEESRLLQGRSSCRHKFRMLGVTPKQLHFGREWRLAAFDWDLVSLRTLPRSGNDPPHRI